MLPFRVLECGLLGDYKVSPRLDNTREIYFSGLILIKLDMLCPFMLNGAIHIRMCGKGPF